MAKAMEELPGKYREVLVLWSQGKLTEKEIAVVRRGHTVDYGDNARHLSVC